VLKVLHHKYFIPITLFVVMFCSFFPSVVAHKKADPDAQYIIPILQQISGPLNYFQKMASLELIDVQPLRDLSLFIDLFFYDHLSLNTFVLQNLLWWWASCFIILELLTKMFPNCEKKKVTLLIIAFSVYPLFSTTIVWGMARKHLMSFFFITLATEALILSRKKIIIITCYLLAMLSQPIGILWPIWAIGYVSFQKKDFKKDFMSIFPVLVGIALFAGIWNHHYYHSSKVYLLHFAPKPDTFFKPADQILALGHYVSDLVIPYFPSFQYTLGHWSTLVGLLLLTLLSTTLYKFKKLKSSSLWVLFFLFPLIPILTQPEMMQDTYLLIPSLGVLILILQNIPNLSERFLYVMIGIGVIFSFQESKIWLSKKTMITQSFINAPNCLTASSTVRIHYTHFEKAPVAALDFVKTYNCINESVMSGSSMQQALYLQSTIMYHDERIPMTDRLEILKQISKRDVLGQTYLTAFFIHEKRFEEANVELLKTMEIYRHQIHVVYDIVNEKVILPYCLEIKNQYCIDVFRRHSVPPVTPFD
jgi:hypothetical protein